MPRNGSLQSSPADHAERSSARLLTPVELADLPGHETCQRCGHILLWWQGQLICVWRPCVEAEDQP
jgi:hypothetical protein